MEWLYQAARPLDFEYAQKAEQHQAQLTKPQGSLGRLEEVVITLAAMQHSSKPELERIMIRVFAADHGVADEGVSAFPQDVTAAMVRNFSSGGAAISVLAKELKADFGVINMGTLTPMSDLPQVENFRIAAGTNNICNQAAMTNKQLQQALTVGYNIAQQALQKKIQMFIGGDMGIGNTTIAAALACAILQSSPESLIGYGTGIDQQRIKLKCEAVTTALQYHQSSNKDSYEVLRCLGGFEISALVGCYIGCGQFGIPILVDGYIATSAALVAVSLNESIRQWMLFSHHSAEQGHDLMLAALDAKPLVALDMRLGEASGAAVVIPIMRLACQLHANMATFGDAGVSQKI